MFAWGKSRISIDYFLNLERFILDSSRDSRHGCHQHVTRLFFLEKFEKGAFDRKGEEVFHLFSRGSINNHSASETN